VKDIHSVNTSQMPALLPITKVRVTNPCVPIIPVRFISVLFSLDIPRKPSYNSLYSDYARIGVSMESWFDFRPDKYITLLQLRPD
jgi:hypothetical protein